MQRFKLQNTKNEFNINESRCRSWETKRPVEIPLQLLGCLGLFSIFFAYNLNHDDI